ncbi:MAG: DEAD/DEAH box helicase [Candidatus Njordarchaeota archaeon]
MKNIAFIRRRGIELEIDYVGSESKAILALSSIDFVVFDEIHDTYRALPFVYWEIKERLEKSGFSVETELNEDLELSLRMKEDMPSLRPYQSAILEKLRKNRYRGVVVLPTGAGKSIIGIHMIATLKQKTLIVVPTIELMHQWKIKIKKFLGISDSEMGLWGSGSRKIKDITITTYQSACKRDFISVGMDKFNLVIFDEVHHLPAETYIEIAKRLIAKYRLGLTATPERVDRKEKLLPIFVGDIIYGPKTAELAKRGFLARYEYEKIKVMMNREERKRYIELMKVYRDYVRNNFPNLSGRKAFDRVVRRAWIDRRAKEALEARMKAKSIAMAPKSKINALNEILKKHRDDKVIIFTRLKRTAHLIGYIFGIPVITSEIPKTIRRSIFDMFRTGKITKIVSAEALDEGVDVPDASVGIIVSGTSSERQYIQRVGRVLRPKEKKAKIYELVTSKSYDEFISKARKGMVRRD